MSTDSEFNKLEKSIQLETLGDYIFKAINFSYLVCILITSSAQGKIPNEGWDYGVGKSTLAINFLKNLVYNGDFEEAKKHVIGFPEELGQFLKPPTRTPGILWDDMQLSVSKTYAHDKDVSQLADFLTTQRTRLAVFIGTAPYRDILQKAFRERFFHFEIIVPYRGAFEIQQLQRSINFYRPEQTMTRLLYKSEGLFNELLPEEQEWYSDWRDERDKKAKPKIKLLQQGIVPEDVTDKQMILLQELVGKGSIAQRTLYGRQNGDGLTAIELRDMGLITKHNTSGSQMWIPTEKGIDFVNKE